MYKSKTVTVYENSPEELKTWSLNKNLLCPDCGDVVFFRKGERISSHFSHEKKQCSAPFSEPESIEHEKGKSELREWLLSQEERENVSLEERIVTTNQRADIFVHPSKTAVEFQCSPIQQHTWERRCKLYESVGIQSIWILGYSMHKYAHPTNRYTHKLNQLEKAILSKYGCIYYYDVLSHQFILLFIESETKKYTIGTEYFVTPGEVKLKDDTLTSYLSKIWANQLKRHQKITFYQEKEKETAMYLKTMKEDEQSNALATKNQVKYIKHLLYKTNKQIPYKLKGMTKTEASSIIRDLKTQQTPGQ